MGLLKLATALAFRQAKISLTSPSPKFAVMRIFDGFPVFGSRVNKTPAASAATISWITTDIPVLTG